MQNVGRIAMRDMGDWWVAFYVLPTPEGTEEWTEMGRIKLYLAADSEERKQLFINVFKHYVAEVIQHIAGKEPTWSEERDGTDPVPS